MSWPEMFIKFKAKANNCGKTDTTIELNRWNLLGFGILMISFPYIIKGTANQSAFDGSFGQLFVYINSITVFVMMLFEIPRLKPQKRHYKVCYYIVTFLLCETSLGLLIAVFFDNVPIPEANLWNASFALITFYPCILSVFSNSLNHLILAFGSFYEDDVSERILDELAKLRAFQILASIVCLCASVFLICCPSNYDYNAFTMVLTVQIYLAILVIFLCNLLEKGVEFSIPSKSIDLALWIRASIAAEHLFIPAILTSIRILIVVIYKMLTLSRIALEAENTKTDDVLNFDNNWFCALICIALFTFGRALWLKMKIDPTCVKSNGNADLHKTIETDV